MSDLRLRKYISKALLGGVAIFSSQIVGQQLPSAASLPLGNTRILGDRLTAPRMVYAVQMNSGEHLEVGLSGDSDTVGLYDLSLYVLHDNLRDFTPATCLSRAFAEAAAKSKQNSAGQTSVITGCRARTPAVSDATGAAPRPHDKAAKIMGSSAKIGFTAPNSSRYYVVADFHGVGMSLQMAVKTTP